MSGFDESSEFELLLEELERAASDLTGSDDQGSAPLDPSNFTSPDLDLNAGDLDPLFEDDGENWGRSPTKLTSEPKSLVDLRVLSLELPFSHDTGIHDELDEPIAEIEPGVVIDHKYEIVGPAPRTTGWEAQHVVLRQRFIVQLLDPAIVDDPILWPKFQSDIHSAGMLGHENIEFVTDFGRCVRYGAYLVKQWIEGPTLNEYLESEGTQSVDVAVGFAHAIGEALAAVHEIGIIHGRLSPDSIRYTSGADGPIWKLLDVCIPGGDDRLVAPEQLRGEATGPEADQYALALLTWKLMLGPDAEPDADASALPAPVVEVLQTAMSDMAFDRWPDIDTFLRELMQVAPPSLEPTIHPFDRREASRLIQERVEEEPSEPSASFADERPRSMRIDVDADALRPHVLVEFNTGARLRREYRRNMLAGGLFVPTVKQLPVGETLQVELRYPAREASIVVPADVVTYDRGTETRPSGFGVAFGPGARGDIETFVAGLNLGLGIAPGHVIEILRKVDRNASLDPGAAFLASRLGPNTTVGAARAMFSGLPYDFDQCLSALIDEQYVAVRPAEKKATRKPKPPRPKASPGRASSRQAAKASPSSAASAEQKRERQPEEEKPAVSESSSAPPSRPHTFEAQEWGDVDRVLETVEYFEEQGNFMAATRMLVSASENAPDVAVYHHRLGLLRARFEMNLSGAREAIARARELEPNNDDFSAAERYIATLVEISAVRTVWEEDFDWSMRWVRTEPKLGKSWFEGRHRGGVELVEVHWRVGDFEVASRDDRWAVVPENDVSFDALERRKAVNMRSRRQRVKRQLEIASRFGGLGPHFERRPVAATRTLNSTMLARTGAGISVQRHDGKPIQLSEGDVTEPKFAPDEQVLAWVEKCGDAWQFFVSPVTGPPTRRATFENRPLFEWLDDSSGLLVVERKSGRVQILDRRTGGKEITTLSGFLNLSLVPAMTPGEAVVVGRRVIGRETWLATHLNVRRGEVIDQYELPDGGTEGLLRADGKFALRLGDGRLLLADLPGGRVKLLSTVSAAEGSIRGANWEENSPLVIVEIVEGTVRVLSLDVDLLCG